MIYETLVHFVMSVSVWYWVLAIGITGTMVIATFIWDNWWLAAYGLVLSGILIGGAVYIEPALLGWNVFTGLRMWISAIYCTLVMLVIIQSVYNALTEGSVIE